ncbi:uncharacterized protein FPOAC1_013661 [Fusarium poae]|uniref:uncharacterized protein n=1 Tax=Fusarium poae TaxID=36050 RepID=UPI001D052B80|nr:uncharacterized protein FPOAC1_013661 [Fusarium poae]KAG8664323.1 hypothetical protein FPOAC1_013661 [Fusarium poae]
MSKATKVSLGEFDVRCIGSRSKNTVRDTNNLTDAHSEKRLAALSHSDKASLHDKAIRYEPPGRTVSDAHGNPLFEGHMMSMLRDTTDIAASRRATSHICTRKSGGSRGKRWNGMSLNAQL